MLHHLSVRNLGVLEDASIEAGEGLTVITGETGAGKTMLLGALRLLLGDKPNTSLIGPFRDHARADGLFTDEEGAELGVSRVVPGGGRSRAYLEGSVVSASVLEDRIGSLVEVVAQHDQLRIKRSREVLAMVDAGLDRGGRAALAGYRRAWEEHSSVLREREQLGGDEMALERELDLVRYQADEIEAAGLQTGDDDDMEAMAMRLRNAEAIREHLRSALGSLESVTDSGGQVVSDLRKVTGMDPEAAESLEAAELIAVHSSELLRTLRDMAESITEDPVELERIDERLTALGELKRKYGRTLADVLDFGMQARSRAEELQSRVARARSIDKDIEAAAKALAAAAGELTSARQACADRLESRVHEHLDDLGLESASIDFVFEEKEPGAEGADRVRLYFASDERMTPAPVEESASGGELSRLVLALRLASHSGDAPTLVFDEVDTGVGGATALALGAKLAELSKTGQVLCVTHLPQVAAHADVQYVVEKEDGVARARRIEGPDRLKELSRMLAGLPDSSLGQEAAAELLSSVRS